MSECCGRPTHVPPPDWDALGPNSEPNSTILVIPGSGPLVISVPHGGTLRPPSIPDRTLGCMEPDTHTAQLALAIHTYLLRRWGALSPSSSSSMPDVGTTPAIIVGKLHRVKVDLARPRGTCASPDSDSDSSGEAGRRSWDEYHGAVREALDEALDRHGRAHLVDLHGQCHRDASEVGCMLTNAELRTTLGRRHSRSGGKTGKSVCGDNESRYGASDALLLERSSLSAMSNLEAYSGLDDAIRGPHSVGTLLQKSGYSAVPSADMPHPCVGADCSAICPSCCSGVDDAGADCGNDTKCCSRVDGSDLIGPSCCDECRPCTGFDVKMWRGTKPAGCQFGPCSYFWGGYACMTYGGGRTTAAEEDGEASSSQMERYRGKVAVTQIETQWRGCRETEDQIDRFGEAAAGAIADFMEHFYPGKTHEPGCA